MVILYRFSISKESHTNGFEDALASIPREGTKRLSAENIVRLKKGWEDDFTNGEPEIFPAGNMPLSGPMVFTFISSLEMREVVSGDSRFNACLTKVRLEETAR